MPKIIFSKALQLFLTTLALTLIVFLLVHALPGDPALAMLGERASAEALEALREQMGLNTPLWQQYLIFLKNLFIHFDLGQSIKSQEAVGIEIFRKFPATIELTVMAMCWALLIGVPVGVWAAVNRSKFWDYLSMGGALAGVSMPIFWLALLLLYFFAVKWPFFPLSGRVDPTFQFEFRTSFYLIESLIRGEFSLFQNLLSHILLPSICLATVPLSVIARFTRSSMLEVLNQDFIRTARAKGLDSVKVVFKHALRNSLIPLCTIVALQFGSLLGGAIITESIFSWPGVGSWLLESVLARDYPSVQGAVLTIGVFFVLINLLTDFIYRWVDPRMKVNS